MRRHFDSHDPIGIKYSLTNVLRSGATVLSNMKISISDGKIS